MPLRRSILFFLLQVILAVGSLSIKADEVDFLVPVRAIYPREQLKAEDFVPKKFLISPEGAGRYLLNLVQITNMEASRFLPKYRPVAMTNIRPQSVVKKGQITAAEFSGSGFVIELKLLALEDGGVNDVVKVRNPDSGRILSARVMPSGTLQVIE